MTDDQYRIAKHSVPTNNNGSMSSSSYHLPGIFPGTSSGHHPRTSSVTYPALTLGPPKPSGSYLVPFLQTCLTSTNAEYQKKLSPQAQRGMSRVDKPAGGTYWPTGRRVRVEHIKTRIWSSTSVAVSGKTDAIPRSRRQRFARTRMMH